MGQAIKITKTGGTEVLELVDQNKPSPGAGEVLIRNHASAVNFIDTIIRRGEMPEGMMPELPFIPGVEGAGVVEAVGEGVSGFRVGDRVAWLGALGAGGYGSYSLIAAPYVVKLADSIPFTDAAAIPVNAMTAYHMLVNLGQARAGQYVLIHAAAGGVGTMAIQIAKHLGLKVIALASAGKLEYARQQGADYAIDRAQDVVARVQEITGGKGVALTLNPVSGASLKTDLEMLAPLGTAVLFGFLAGPPEGTFAEDLAKHFGKSIAVRVSDLYTFYNHDQAGFSRDMAEIFRLLEEGVIQPQIEASLRLQDAPEAHRKLEASEVSGKLVLTL